jgi:flagellum-specific ATP synthase
MELAKYLESLERVKLVKVNGRVSQVIGLTIQSTGPSCKIGDLCEVVSPDGKETCLAEVVGFRENRVLLMPLGEVTAISPGSEVVATGRRLTVPVGFGLLGRVLDGLGNPIDDGGKLETSTFYAAERKPPNPMARPRITEPLGVGVKAIDGLLTVGRGQRIGIFAGSGVGKSTLLGMIARNTEADVNVIALVGERGREVREFLEKDLGEAGLARSVVVVATSDQPALLRIKAALVATSIAEFFRDQGKHVMLLMDSVTRFALAQRELGLAVGEPPTTRGYTPSVFALLPKLLERAGTGEKGSITGFYTVLVDGDDMNEPIADAVRGTLDGHIILSRPLAYKGHYPAIDILASVSRVMNDIVTPEHRKLAHTVKRIAAVYTQSEDLVNIGAYHIGSNHQLDIALRHIDAVWEFCRQEVDEHWALADVVETMRQQFGGVEL